ncbi:hypothetical protein HRJ35_14930 [Shewanella oneidensis MR-1]|uniref:Mu phage uncharacterized protein E18 n=1 Tax=Shewanella oneidensis (strain ATCC 700550 / JCM 31522 / CIP 106686 / LMG 19005 / NCIMB 14063 / MR-1) TaxID=211586 RepID=Q8EDS1_SHEON|nr:phage protein [Shewanella oneidensis]AAN55700.1 Mu phage uncharacterized protein E18 [Shewanella oneidensis MR-1]MDX5995658.1 hypothetical protein [Shewanella oneidensis]MEE2026291.1 hypothetical protein [Shewanella oneidensis]QKG97175.1 hypothetical protein HRJ35_14930 [Shewanella oneidensis MR-1]
MGSNWEYAKTKGRAMRLNAELAAYHTGEPVTQPPFFSHCGTMQSYFNRGWHGVTQCDIRIHLDKNIVPTGTDKLSKLRSLRACHSL